MWYILGRYLLNEICSFPFDSAQHKFCETISCKHHGESPSTPPGYFTVIVNTTGKVQTYFSSLPMYFVDSPVSTVITFRHVSYTWFLCLFSSGYDFRVFILMSPLFLAVINETTFCPIFCFFDRISI
jgi:hypothetical protein